MQSYSFVDANSWGYASHNTRPLTVGTFQTQAIFGFLHAIRELKFTYPNDKVAVLWDGRAEWRYEVEPEYKSGRATTPVEKAARDAYQEQIPYIAEALERLGVHQIHCSNKEADDLGGFFVGKLADGSNKIRLHTGDQDWLQLIRPGVSWLDRRDDARRVNQDNFTTFTGFASPLQFLEFKCLQGDTSDSIPGVGKVGKTRAKEVLAAYGSIKNYWKACDDGTFVPRLAWEKHLASKEARAAFVRNLRLMQLLKVPKPDPKLTKNNKGEFNPDSFLKLCEELNFKSILARSERYLEPFRPAK